MMAHNRAFWCHSRTLLLIILFCFCNSFILSAGAGSIVRDFSKDLRGYCNQASSVYSKKLLIKLMKSESLDAACRSGNQVEKLTRICRNQNQNEQKCNDIVKLYLSAKARKSGKVFGQ